MATVRRIYSYLVCAISLQAVSWALISLLWQILFERERADITPLAFQIAVLVIGLPVFLIHWLWAQRLAARDAEERTSLARRIYLYLMLAAFLGPALFQAYALGAALFRRMFGSPLPDYLTLSAAIGRPLMALLVLLLLWGYQRWIIQHDDRAADLIWSAIDRIYQLVFSLVALAIMANAAADLFRWLMDWSGTANAFAIIYLTDILARLALALPLWLRFWIREQRHVALESSAREALVRRAYLYLVILVATLAAVTSAAVLLSGLLRAWLGLPAQGKLSDMLPTTIFAVLIWAYHAWILRGDAVVMAEAARQALIRRIYRYLVAAIGLLAALIGLAGLLSVLIRLVSGDSLTDDLREQIAWFSSALIAGLPVWLAPWRQAQIIAAAATDDGAEERHSLIRRAYLYFYLFLATMAILGGLVTIAFQIISFALGNPLDDPIRDIGIAAAYTLVAAGVWALHGTAMRADGRVSDAARARALADTHVVLVDSGDGRFGTALRAALQRALPGLTLDLIAPALTADMPEEATAPTPLQRLSNADLIVGPWTIIMADGALTSAIMASPAEKLLAPLRSPGWQWVGVERWSDAAAIEQTVRAVRQILAGEEVKPAGRMHGCATAVIVLGALLLISQLAQVVVGLLMGGL